MADELVPDKVDFPLTGGLAQHVDRKLVEPGSFVRYRNVQQLKKRGVTKREGYGYLPAPDTTVRRLDVLGNDLVSYSEGEAPAVAPHAKVTSDADTTPERKGDSWLSSITSRPVSRHFAGVAAGSCLPVGDRIVWVYWSTLGGLYFKVEDAFGTEIAAERFLTGNPTPGPYFRAAVTDGRVVVLYRTPNGTGSMHLAVLDPVTLAVVDSAISVPLSLNQNGFDMIAPAICPGYIFAVWSEGPNSNSRLRAGTFDINTFAPVLLSSTAPNPLGQDLTFAHAIDVGSAVAVAYSRVNPAGTAREVRITQWAPLASDGTFVTTAPFDKVVFSMSNISLSLENYGAAIVPDTEVGGGDGYQVGTVFAGAFRVNQVDDAGDVVPGTAGDFIARGLHIVCAPFVYQGRVFWPLQAVGPLLDDDGEPLLYTGGIVHLNTRALTLSSDGPYDPDTGSLYLVASYKHEAIPGGFFNTSILSFPRPAVGADGVRIPVNVQVGPVPPPDQLVRDSLTGVDEVLFSLGPTEPGVGAAAEAAGLLNRSGGLTSWLDGTTWGETGFLQRPVVSHTTVQVALGAGLPKDVYTYAIHYESTDRAGNVHRGEPTFYTADTTLEPGSFDYNIRLALEPASLTQRAGVTYAIHRTEGGKGAPYYRMTPRTFLESTPDLDPVSSIPSVLRTYTDNMRDNVLVDLRFGELYTAGGIRANVAPPPSLFACVHGRRLILVSADDPAELWFSKEMVRGEPPSFGRGFNLRFDNIKGGMNALASMDDKAILFGPSSIHYIVGAGPPDTGQGGGFSDAIVVSLEVGCVDPRSVVATKFGVFFLGPQGLMVLTRSLEVEFAGAPVEDLTGLHPVCLRAQVDSKAGHVYWLMSTADLEDDQAYAVFDFTNGTWGEWIIAPSDGQRDQVIWRGKHVTLDKFGAAERGRGDTPGNDADGTYVQMLIELPEMNLGALASFRRLYSVSVTGKKLHPHSLVVELRDEYSSPDGPPSQQRTHDLSDTSTVAGLPDYRVKTKVKNQRRASSRVRIYDVPVVGTTNAVPRTGSALSGVTFEFGALPQTARVSANNQK